MLVVTRKLGEEIRIGEQVTVKVLGIRGQKVRIGVEAPQQVRVLREELAPLQTAEASPAALVRARRRRRACRIAMPV